MGEPRWGSTLTNTVPWVTRRRGQSHCQHIADQDSTLGSSMGVQGSDCRVSACFPRHTVTLVCS